MGPRPASEAMNLAEAYFEFERDGRARVADAEGLRRDGIDALIRQAVFGGAEEQTSARYLIETAAQELGAVPSSIHELYMARGRGQAKGFTVPAMNIRGMTYDVVRAALRAAKRHEVGALIFEIARSEMGYTHQVPSEYASCVLAAAIKENWHRSVFLQGDHFQFNAKAYAADPDKEAEGIRSLIRDAVDASFYNIDIDSSTLVELAQSTVSKQQLVNSQRTAEMVDLIRGLEPAELTISIGGEIGEVGKKNSTEDELRAYLDQLKKSLARRRRGATSLSKVSIQTGTHHGGLVGPDGNVIDVNVDFDTLRRLSTVAVEEYGLAGCVQHGASTLPDEMFHEFPKAGTAEIHLATGFQNTMMDHPDFPASLKRTIYEYLDAQHADERKPNETPEQFHYKTRKKSFGPFKLQLWGMPVDSKTKILHTLEERFAYLYRELHVTNTTAVVKHHVQPIRVPRHPPSRSSHKKP